MRPACGVKASQRIALSGRLCSPQLSWRRLASSGCERVGMLLNMALCSHGRFQGLQASLSHRFLHNHETQQLQELPGARLGHRWYCLARLEFRAVGVVAVRRIPCPCCCGFHLRTLHAATVYASTLPTWNRRCEHELQTLRSVQGAGRR